MKEQQVIAALESLERKGFVKSRLDENGRKRWQISQKGLDYLKMKRDARGCDVNAKV